MSHSAAIRVNGELSATPSDLGADALFPVYSITKTLTAICALRLTESGVLSLDVPAHHWLPDVNLPEAITLTHLLRHTARLRDYGGLPAYHDAVRRDPGRPWARQQFLDAVLSEGLLFAPGEAWAYSNVGYMLVVEIMERATGETFADILDRLVAVPLRLQRTTVLQGLDDLMVCVPGFGSEVTADKQIVDVRGRYHPGWCAPRLVASTAAEITQVFDAVVRGHFLAPVTFDRMVTWVPWPGLIESGMVIGSGMGLFTDRVSPRGRNYHHGGAGPGCDVCTTVYPDTPLGCVTVAVFVATSCGQRSDALKETLLARLLDGQ